MAATKMRDQLAYMIASVNRLLEAELEEEDGVRVIESSDLRRLGR